MIIKNEMPSVEILNKLLVLNAEEGLLWWKPRTPEMFTPGKKTVEHQCNAWNAKFAGTRAFSSIANCYYASTIFKISYKAHRIIYKMHFGTEPDEIDHIDGNPLNNKISNLRNVSRSENMKNDSRQHDNSSGVTGVCWDKSRNKWAARIECDKQVYHLGRYESFDEAVAARKMAEKEFGFHKEHGNRNSKIREVVMSR